MRFIRKAVILVFYLICIVYGVCILAALLEPALRKTYRWFTERYVNSRKWRDIRYLERIYRWEMKS